MIEREFCVHYHYDFGYKKYRWGKPTGKHKLPDYCPTFDFDPPDGFNCLQTNILYKLYYGEYLHYREFGNFYLGNHLRLSRNWKPFWTREYTPEQLAEIERLKIIAFRSSYSALQFNNNN